MTDNLYNNIHIVITASHAFCSMIYNIINNTHLCDFRSENLAKALENSCKKLGISYTLLINKTIPRQCIYLKDTNCCMLNRYECRSHEWRHNLTEILQELKKQGKDIFLLDCHSYPLKSFGGADFALLFDKPLNEKMDNYVIQLNNKINNMLINNNSYCNLFYGNKNDIIDEALGMGIKAILLEVIEEKWRMNDNILGNVCDVIIKHIVDMFREGKSGGFGGIEEFGGVDVHKKKRYVLR